MSNFVDIIGKTITFSAGATYASTINREPKPLGADPLSVATQVRLTSQALSFMNSCTFLYDRSWINAVQGTLPICFFFVKSMQEICQTQVTEKPMIFYHEDNGRSDNSKKAVTQIITDNIVAKPKTYQLEVLIPYSMSQIITSSPYTNINTLSAIGTGREMQELNYTTSTITAVIRSLFDTFDALATIDLSTSMNTTISALGEKNYNKKSLEAMWRNRSLCVMKTWDGWNFKDVAITDINISKQPDEDNIYRGTITVQDVPVFTMLAQNKLLTLDGLKKAKQDKAKAENAVYAGFLNSFNTTGGRL